MANNYDQINKIRDKYKKEIEEKDALILKQTEKIEKLEEEIPARNNYYCKEGYILNSITNFLDLEDS